MFQTPLTQISRILRKMILSDKNTDLHIVHSIGSWIFSAHFGLYGVAVSVNLNAVKKIPLIADSNIAMEICSHFLVSYLQLAQNIHDSVPESYLAGLVALNLAEDIHKSSPVYLYWPFSPRTRASYMRPAEALAALHAIRHIEKATLCPNDKDVLSAWEHALALYCTLPELMYTTRKRNCHSLFYWMQSHRTPIRAAALAGCCLQEPLEQAAQRCPGEHNPFLTGIILRLICFSPHVPDLGNANSYFTEQAAKLQADFLHFHLETSRSDAAILQDNLRYIHDMSRGLNRFLCRNQSPVSSGTIHILL